MARQTIVKLVDDLDGTVAQETVRFGLDGREYEIDLSAKNAKKLRADLAVYVERGSKLSARVAGGRQRARGGNAGARVDREQNQAIREWAIGQGYDIAGRGRIKQEIVEAFHRSAGR